MTGRAPGVNATARRSGTCGRNDGGERDPKALSSAVTLQRRARPPRKCHLRLTPLSDAGSFPISGASVATSAARHLVREEGEQRPSVCLTGQHLGRHPRTPHHHRHRERHRAGARALHTLTRDGRHACTRTIACMHAHAGGQRGGGGVLSHVCGIERRGRTVSTPRHPPGSPPLPGVGTGPWVRAVRVWSTS